MSDQLAFASYAVFKASGHDAGADAARLSSEIEELFAKAQDSVQVRGIYSTTGFTAHADLMFWFTSSSSDRLQDLLAAEREQLARQRSRPIGRVQEGRVLASDFQSL